MVYNLRSAAVVLGASVLAGCATAPPPATQEQESVSLQGYFNRLTPAQRADIHAGRTLVPRTYDYVIGETKGTQDVVFRKDGKSVAYAFLGADGQQQGPSNWLSCQTAFELLQTYSSANSRYNITFGNVARGSSVPAGLADKLERQVVGDVFVICTGLGI